MTVSATVFAAPSATAPGLAQSVAEPTGFWRGEPNRPVPNSLHGGHLLHVTGVKKLIASGTAAVVDVSRAPRIPQGLAPGAWMPLPHKALPNAIWVPGAGEGEVGHEFDAFLRRCVSAATHGDFDHPLVVYCHERCWLSWNAAKRLISYGYRRVYWFPEGIEGWGAAGLPVAVVQPVTPSADGDHS